MFFFFVFAELIELFIIIVINLPIYLGIAAEEPKNAQQRTRQGSVHVVDKE